MAKDTSRDRVWDAVLRYSREWEAKDSLERRNKHGFTAAELIEFADLDESRKTVSDTLLTMADYGWVTRTTSGRGGRATQYRWTGFVVDDE